MNKELEKLLKKEGYYNLREIPGRGICGLKEFIFTIGLVEGLGYSGYAGRYCYPKDLILDTIVAIESWDGKNDPIGDWIVYKGVRGEYHNLNNKNDE